MFFCKMIFVFFIIQFFVACDPKAGVDLWRSKYMLRTAMIPSFISTEQAEKVTIIASSNY